MLGDIEEGLDLLETSDDRASHGVPWSRMRLNWWCSKSIVDEVEQHPRYRALLAEKGYGDEWTAELVQMVNQLTDITGIHIQSNEES